jgi:hypothetical protein
MTRRDPARGPALPVLTWIAKQAPCRVGDRERAAERRAGAVAGRAAVHDPARELAG